MSQGAVLLFGANGPLGLEIAELAKKQGRDVIACARSDNGVPELEALGAQVVRIDVMDKPAVEALFAEHAPACDLVMSTIGGNVRADPSTWPDATGNIHVIEAAEAHGPKRFMLITTIGCGESRPALSERAEQLLGPIATERTKAEERLKTSSLDWSIVRPGGLGPAGAIPATGKAELSQDPMSIGMIARSEVARLAFEVLADPSSVGQVYHAIDLSLPTPSGH